MRMFPRHLMMKKALFEATTMYCEELWRDCTTSRKHCAPSLFEQWLVEWDACFLFTSFYKKSCYPEAHSDVKTVIWLAPWTEKTWLIGGWHQSNKKQDLRVVQPIMQELCLYCCLWYCAGGSYSSSQYSSKAFHRNFNVFMFIVFLCGSVLMPSIDVQNCLLISQKLVLRTRWFGLLQRAFCQ